MQATKLQSPKHYAHAVRLKKKKQQTDPDFTLLAAAAATKTQQK
jgi:hypothetical protein